MTKFLHNNEQKERKTYENERERHMEKAVDLFAVKTGANSTIRQENSIIISCQAAGAALVPGRMTDAGGIKQVSVS